MPRFSKYFWFCSILFTLHQIVEKWYSIPYVHAYLDDLLAPGIVLGLALAFFQNVFPADADYRLPRYFVLLFVIWYSWLFEWYFPSRDSRHYADYLDIIAYFSGACAFWIWGNKPLALEGVTKKKG